MAKIGFGVVYPWETRAPINMTPGEFAKRVEDLGFDSMFINDGARAYEVFILLTAAAMATSRLKVGTSVLLLPLRHPILMAKSVVTLDQLSKGRLVLGVGVGGERAKDFEAHGVRVKERGRRANEALEIMLKLWQEPEASYQGKYYSFEGVGLATRPFQKPHPPIWVGGRSGGDANGTSAAVSRTVKYADGFYPYLCSPEQYKTWWAQVNNLARLEGRDVATILPATLSRTSIYESAEQAKAITVEHYGGRGGYGNFAQTVERYYVYGSVQDCIKRLEQYVDGGCRYFVFQWACAPQDIWRHVEQIAKEIVPHFS